MKKRAIFLAVTLGALSVEANPFVVLEGNRRIEGVNIRARRDGTVILLTAQGQEFTFSPDQYVRAVADRPSEYDEGLRSMQAGNFDEAIARFLPIVEKYRYLSWDEQALIALAHAYREKGDTSKSLEAYQSLFRINPNREKEREIRWGYYETLQQAGRTATLVPKLDELIRNGEPVDAAKAYVLRGMVNEANNRLEAAVLDYLRAVMFFGRQAEVMPEAYLRVAQVLEKMRDNRSREWYRNVVEEFPDSPQAEAAKQKL